MISKLILALLILVVGMLGFAMWRVEKNRTPNLPEILEALRDDKVNLAIKNEWTQNKMLINEWTSGGEKVGVHTFQREGESEEDFEARHESMVETRKKKYPPD